MNIKLSHKLAFLSFLLIFLSCTGGDDEMQEDEKIILDDSYFDENYNVLADMVIHSDDSYTIAVHFQDGEDVLLVKFDESGTVIFQRKFNYGRNTAVGSLELTHDGGYLIAGGSRGEVTRIVKIDSEGFEEWTFEETSRSTININHATELSNGQIIFGGTIRNTLDSEVLAGMLDNNGGRIWVNTYDFNRNNNHGEEVHIGNTDTDFFLVGSSSEEPIGGDLLLLKIDIEGSIIWEKTYSNSNAFGPDQKILKISANEYLLGHTLYTSDFDIIPQFIKVDNDGNELSRYEFAKDRIFQNFEMTKDNEIVSALSQIDESDIFNFAILKFNNGIKRWERIYGNDLNKSGNSIKVKTNGGFIYGGSTISGPTSGSVAILNLDENGFLIN